MMRHTPPLRRADFAHVAVYTERMIMMPFINEHGRHKMTLIMMQMLRRRAMPLDADYARLRDAR